MEKRFIIDLIYRHYLLEARFNALIKLLENEKPELLIKYNDPKVLSKCIESARTRIEEISKFIQEQC